MTSSDQFTNADPSEIDKFEQLAGQWWNPKGEMRPLHEMNPVRANYIDQRAPVAGQKVLDIGCGGGLLSEALAHRGAQVTGIDLGELPLQVAREHAAQSQLTIDYRQQSAEDLAAEAPASFDIITCMEMLEHVPDPAAIIGACQRLLKPGGQAFFSTLNRTPKAWLLAVVGAEYVLKLLPKGTHEYAKFIRPSELSGHIRQHNMRVQDISGMVYNPLTKTFRLSEKDVDVNYLIHASKP